MPRKSMMVQRDIEPLAYDVNEACLALRVSEHILLEWTHRSIRPLPSVKAGTRYRYPVEAIRKWLMEESEQNQVRSELKAVAASTTQRAGTRAKQ